MMHLQDRVQIKFVGVEPIENIYNFIEKKLSRRNPSFKFVKDISFNISKDTLKNGKVYCISAVVKLNNAGFMVKERGKDIYRLLDAFSDKFYSRLSKIADKRTKKKLKNIDGVETFEFIEEQRVPKLKSIDIDKTADKYSVLEKNKYSHDSPLHVEEAIQLMELQGKQLFMFRNILNGKYSVVYKVQEKAGKNGYGLVEPKVG